MTITRPTKQQVRDHMERRSREESPPPTPDEIRRQLGWYLMPGNGRVPEVSN